MTCFAKEASVLEQEWPGIPFILHKKLEIITRRTEQVSSGGGHVWTPVLFLRRCFSTRPQAQLDCPQCEHHREDTTAGFLADLLEVLQDMNVNNCPPPNPPGGRLKG